MNLGFLTATGLSDLLRHEGVSSTGVTSITENNVTGRMLLDFCEEDIKDLFTVFKDRFLVRKLVRESKTQTSPSGLKGPASFTNTLQHNQSATYRFSPPSSSQVSLNDAKLRGPSPGSQRLSSPPTVSPVFQRHDDRVYSEGNPWPNVNNLQRQHSPVVQRQVTSPIPTNFISRSESGLVSTPIVLQQISHRPTADSTEVMNFKISKVESLQESVPVKTETAVVILDDDSPKRPPFPSSPVTVSSTSAIGPSPDCAKPQLDYQSKITNEEHGTSQNTFTNSNQNQELKSERPSKVLSMEERRAAITEVEFMAIGSSIKQYTAEELLGKKSLRGKPSDAQRLGQVLMRNAAQAAKFWDTAPLLKDIPNHQKEMFSRYVVAAAPQLADYHEVIWAKLRVCLQNRRKYLLDKEIGKRNSKRVQSSFTEDHADDTSQFVDLTE
ncbi:hypothetical protein CHS0354_039175 [Potamilus streckersoni]|uniref:Uncharacterized protein n=1 Tax=Potamilus streckersoni TaxID=2493646 RepID=A0AAE0SE58_9BIVA|nr:hypothetical protein CHS0354_039175 [Potamilus streckersoni]